MPRRRSTSTAPEPGTASKRARKVAAVAERDGREAAVVAGEPERTADRRVDEAAGRPRRGERHLDSLEQSHADLHRAGSRGSRSGGRARSRRGSGCTSGRSRPARARALRAQPEGRPTTRRTAGRSCRAPETRPTRARRSRRAGGGDRRRGRGHGWRRGGRRRCGRRWRRGRLDGNERRRALHRRLRRPALRSSGGRSLVTRIRVRDDAGEGTSERRRAEDREARRAAQARQAVVSRPRARLRRKLLHGTRVPSRDERSMSER